LSPVLSAKLPDVVADAVVLVREPEELAFVLAEAYAHDVAVTPRGKGTGNYGQAVPLAGGVVVDTTGISGVLDIQDGSIHARTGTSFTRLETAARTTGQELAIFPSTVSSALGGFLAGGAGGTGSIENGFAWEGYVSDLELLPCWDVPEPLRTDAVGALAHLHAYGTTGCFASARVALVPARQWTALFASFAHFDAAVAAGHELLRLDPAPRNASIDDADLVALLGAHPAMPARRDSLRVTLDESTVTAASGAVARHGGTVELVSAQLTAMLVSLSFNHVTLRAKRANPSICHLQVGGPALVEHHEALRATLPGGLLHLDAYMLAGARGFGGLYLSRFVDESTLRAGMREIEELGVRVVDAHTWMLGAHGDLSATMHAARANDPKGLLNPGKLPRDDR